MNDKIKELKNNMLFYICCVTIAEYSIGIKIFTMNGFNNIDSFFKGGLTFACITYILLMIIHIVCTYVETIEKKKVYIKNKNNIQQQNKMEVCKDKKDFHGVLLSMLIPILIFYINENTKNIVLSFAFGIVGSIAFMFVLDILITILGIAIGAFALMPDVKRN